MTPAPTAATGSYPRSEHTTPTRKPDRASYDREVVHSILDQEYVCHLGFVRDGRPVVLPTLYARVGERLYAHGSTGSQPLRAAGQPNGAAGRAGSDGGPGGPDSPDGDGPGMPVCLTVTHVDGLVLARTAFHHSLNYRSVVVQGTARQVTDRDERVAALDALVDNVLPGRAADCRPADAKELAATAVIALDLNEVSAKIRSGGPSDDPEDVPLPYWTGVVPVSRAYGEPVPADDLAPGTPLPEYLRRVG